MSSKVPQTKVISSFLWVLLEKFGYSGISLLSTLILARLLSPFEFGLVGSVAIISSIANMIVESGMGAALVNKKEPTKEDFNTVFSYNLLVSIVLYTAIFLAAPAVAAYFDKEILKDIVRVLSLTLLFNSITLVQRTILLRNLWFKKQLFIALASLVVSVLVAIFLAYTGWGVWAIVAQLVLYSAIYSLLIFFIIRYIPKIQFSVHSFKTLLGFGGRVTLSSALSVGYNDIIGSVVAKVYSIQTTGLYTQSQKLIGFPLNIFRALFDGAAFPILSKVKGQQEFNVLCSQINRGIYFAAFPLLLLIPFNTAEIIQVVLGEQWLEASAIFKILSIGILVSLIEISAFSILKAAGAVKIYLRAGIYKTLTGLAILAVTYSFSIQIMLWGIVLTNLLSAALAIYFVHNMTGYRLRKQLADIVKPLAVALVANSTAYICVQMVMVDHFLVNLLTYGVVLIFTLVVLLRIFKVRELEFVLGKIKNIKV